MQNLKINFSEITKDVQALVSFSVTNFDLQAKVLIVSVSSSDGIIRNSTTKIDISPGGSGTGSFGLNVSSAS